MKALVERRRFARSGLLSIAFRLLNMALGFLVAILLARFLGVEGYGTYSFVFAVVSVIAIPSQLGLPALLVRETAKDQKLGRLARTKSLWIWSAKLGIGLACLGSVFLAFGFFVMRQFPQLHSVAIDSVTLVAWSAVLLPLITVGALRGGALRGLGRVILGQVPEDIVRPLSFVLMILVFVFVSGERLQPASAMMLHVFAAALSFLLGTWFFLSSRPSGFRGLTPAKSESVEWIRSAWPLALNASSHIINRYADVIILGILSSVADVGIYRVAAQGALLVSVGLKGLNMVIAPKVAGHYTSGNLSAVQSVATYTSVISFLFALPLAVLFILFGDSILGWVFGTQYSDAYLPLVILVIGQLINALVGPVGLFLSMCGHERVVAKTLTMVVGLNIVLNLILIPLYGALGAAFATAFSMSCWNIFLSRRVKSIIGIECIAFTPNKFRYRVG